MKRQLRSALAWMFSRLPVSRAAYAERDILQAKVDALERLQSQPAALSSNEAPAPPAVSIGLLADSPCFALQGGLLGITADCRLGRAGDVLLLPFDQVMYPRTVAHSGWALETLEFLEQRVDAAGRYTVLDIGANVGLFSRQAAFRFPNITRFHCIEAEPGNFRALQYNLGSMLGARGALWNVALSDADGEMHFYRDAENIGNYSLNDDAMRGRSFDTITVRAVATGPWLQEHVRPQADERLIWKSDTQGYDELIISLTPLEIWDRVEIAVIELWRIRKPDFDRAAFAARIEAFPNKSIGRGDGCSMADIFTFLDGSDYHHDDLYLWR